MFALLLFASAAAALLLLLTWVRQRDGNYLRLKKALLTEAFVRLHFGALQGLVERAESMLVNR